VTGSLEHADLSVAQWVFDHGQPAGLGTDTLPAAPAQYLPMIGTDRTLGVLAVRPTQARRLLLPEQRHLLETFAGQIALAVERSQMAEHAEQARVAVETESLRNTLLASISHDLRTPLAVITGAASALSDPLLALDAAARVRLAKSIDVKAHEMSELISNVLDLMRFESGEVRLRRDWQTVDDLVGTALAQLAGRTGDHPVDVVLPTDLPEVFVDGPLITQVLVNLIDNAVKHTPPGTRVWVSATSEAETVVVRVEDSGPGLPPGDPERLFAKFYRGREEGNTGGAGLGLAICRAIIRAHGGRIEGRTRDAGGASFSFSLAATETPS
jgi:two-component system sensor histidine kinase KdpD